MAQKQTARTGAVKVCQINTVSLRQVNQRITYYLDRLPLKHQHDVVALNRLMEDQERLIRVHFKGRIPCRIAVFNDNEKYRACNLRQRFKDAAHRNKIKINEEN